MSVSAQFSYLNRYFDVLMDKFLSEISIEQALSLGLFAFTKQLSIVMYASSDADRSMNAPGTRINLHSCHLLNNYLTQFIWLQQNLTRLDTDFIFIN